MDGRGGGRRLVELVEMPVKNLEGSWYSGCYFSASETERQDG